MNVCFVDHVFEDPEDIVVPGCAVAVHGPVTDADRMVALARDADVLCMRDQFLRLSGEVIDRLPRLRLIVTRSTGVDHIDLRHAAARGIPVCNVPGYGANTVAEFAAGLLLAVSRRIPAAAARYGRGDYSLDGVQGVDLEGRTLGIAGTGSIGRKMARIGRGLGMRVLAHDRDEDGASARTVGFAYVSLETLLEESDVVSLHLPLTPETRHVIGRDALGRMKPGAILLNTGRGELVDTGALIEALRAGRLFGAGLDVLEGERRTVHDFSGLNVVATTHVGWYTREAVRRIVTIALDNIRAFMKGEPVHVVNGAFLGKPRGGGS